MTCRWEIDRRAKTFASPFPFKSHGSSSCGKIRVVFQNAHRWDVEVFQKDHAGREYSYVTVSEGDIRIGRSVHPSYSVHLLL